MSEKDSKQLGTHGFEEHNTATYFAAQSNIFGANNRYVTSEDRPPENF